MKNISAYVMTVQMRNVCQAMSAGDVTIAVLGF